VKGITKTDCEETFPDKRHAAVQLFSCKQYEVKGTALPAAVSWKEMFTEYCVASALSGMYKDA